MCGIAGWVAAAPHAPGDDVMRPVLQALAHRGPDGEGMCVYESARHRVVLGHRRLAIIDPQGGRQPMRDETAGEAGTCNGEIYKLRGVRGVGSLELLTLEQ